MWKQIIRRNRRQPLPSLAVILFAAVLTVVLCFLCRAKQEEQRSFQEAYASVPVFFKVTDLDGSKVTAIGGIEGWVVDLLAESRLTPNLSSYVQELHMRVSYTNTYTSKAHWVYQVYDEKRDKMMDEYEPVEVTGITSTYVAEELSEEWGGEIFWNSGYDESIFATDEFVCIVPEELRDETEITGLFKYIYQSYPPETREIVCTFKVVGYYADPGNSRLYCPYSAMEWVYARLRRTKDIEQIGAILNDNDALDELRETAAYWFAEPNPAGTPTPWGRFDFEYYPYALDINDTMLKNLAADMKNSMRINNLASAVVFVLSACAGFLTGFLVIRSRKREIALMRTMGASHPAIYLELSLEQLVCVAAGIVIGGGYSLWQPVGQLCLFGGIYFIGLSAALLVFLRKNLLTTVKEDE